ncbi:MAG TPA: four helix bundle protein [Vicinamibacterales bacterium]|nr:four helix bundle protein [Vicinamibacterales bacterium]
MAAATHFEELDCWQLANELKLALYALIRRPAVRRDFDLVKQIRKAAASSPSNIAEGFGRRTHKDFAHFLDFARGSLYESQNHIRDCRDRHYCTNEEYRALITLARRASGATAALQRYLRNNPDP